MNLSRQELQTIVVGLMNASWFFREQLKDFKYSEWKTKEKKRDAKRMEALENKIRLHLKRAAKREGT